ncbi:hypothetical protein [Selenomonas sp. oral taxon 136]|uniref:hypothetical protein n=1 Tax=Selenomonas sp. oral taxon 136 TaxID=713030 RepID=UPI000B1BB58A|nr:hypothetical protein [Selenomonas sp. oral taxon 136]
MRIIIEGTKDEIAAILRLEESPQVDVGKVIGNITAELKRAMQEGAHENIRV